MSRRSSRAIAALVLAAAAFAGVVVAQRAQRDEGSIDGPLLPADARRASVERVVDGDTVALSGAGQSRLIGVDTPEFYGRRECYGIEASEYAKAQLKDQTVRYTVGREARDRYGRLLVYAWLEDGRSFNALLVARGYATPLSIPPNSDHSGTFGRLAREARRRGLGLWSSCRRSPFSPKQREGRGRPP